MDIDITCNRCKAPLTHTCGDGDLPTAIKRLYKFVPEDGTPEAVIAEGKKSGMWTEDDDAKDLPFFSETFLYSLLGKEDARTVLALLGSVIRACGIESWKLQHEAWRELAIEKLEREYESTRREAIRRRVKRNNVRMCTCGHPYVAHSTPENHTDWKTEHRVCNKCKTKCTGFTPKTEGDILESHKKLPQADRDALMAIKTQLDAMKKDNATSEDDVLLEDA